MRRPPRGLSPDVRSGAPTNTFLAATIVGTPLMVAWGLGLIFLIPLWIAEIVDLFTLPSQVRHANAKLLAAQQAHPGHAVPIR